VIEIKYFKDYFVDEKGNIYSKKRTNMIKLKPFISKFGYEYVRIRKNNKPFNKQVHRIVAENYIYNQHNKPQVNHIDGKKLNNHVSNLEWVTASENAKHAIKLGLWDKKILFEYSMKKRTPVLMLSLDDEPLLWFYSQNEASRATGINQGSIFNCCVGKEKQTGGYKWKYVSEQTTKSIVQE